MLSPTERFSSRVENYIKYRPGYPPEIIRLLAEECGLVGESVVADVGSGTGILSELFLRHGNAVYGVEPNREMREAGERLLRAYPRFRSVAASAEATTLGDASVDIVVAGQAFHWFRHDEARREFARILKRGGAVVLIWNERRTSTTPFLVAYERLLLRYGTDYEAVNQRVGVETIPGFFGHDQYHTRVFNNRQDFDFESLRGRLLSSSYVPEASHPDFAPMLAELRAIFDAHQQQGRVAFEYDTRVFYGQLTN
ncbi:MAG TPA: class I SAM-dependent methyltransferase [Pyrinomonadaceae bacterium]|jgi:ubiquinone/menaquinone biosynthesis C-methylase UbiE|nr:class I SAM-dependent methyltransferase [Pyrinomonadaceae bacterium]